VIPPAVLEQIDQAFLTVLRRDHPDAAFIVRDIGEGERAVSPDDLDAALKVRASTPANVDAVDNGREHGAAAVEIEAIPERPERASGLKARKAGR
jgi:hypothetical protein